MTLDEVRKRIDEIRIKARACDHEAAHQMEDQLHRSVLSYLSGSGIFMPELAREALNTLGLDFERHCS